MRILHHRLLNCVEKEDTEEVNIEIGIENNSLFDILGNGRLIFREKKCIKMDFLSFVNLNPDIGYKINFSFTNANYYNNNLKKYIYISVTINEDILLKKLEKKEFSNEEIVYFKSLFLNNNNFEMLDLWKEKWTPDIQVSKQPNKIKTKLFKYQLQSLNWMKNIESSNNKFKLKCNRKFSEIFNPEEKYDYFDSHTLNMYSNKINSNETFYFTAKGAILADEMGLGKTLTTISLISEKPYVYNANRIDEDLNYEIKNINNKEFLVTKSTLIICPSHLTKQWSDEITKNCKSLKHICILTKTNHEKYTLNDLLNCDVVITSFQFLTNINYYVNYMKLIDVNNIRYTSSYLYGDNLKKRFKSMSTYYTFNKNTIETEKILFESIFWNRVIIDEAHEIFNYGYGYSGSDNNYLQHLLRNFNCNYKWYISGTPFFDKHSLINVMNFLDFKTEMIYNGIEYKLNLDESLHYGLSDKNIVNSIFQQIYVRNTKESVKDQLNIPQSIFEDIFLDLSDFEENIYKSCEKLNSRDYLRKICCNIQICDWFNNGNMNNILNFDEVKDQLIKENNEKIKKTEKSIELLDSSIAGYEARKKMLQNIIMSCKFFLNCINSEKFKINEESCPICKCEFEDPIITKCGHHFCFECINEVLSLPSNKKECPICREDLKNSNMFKLKSDSNTNKKDELDELVYKYGTKIAKLIRLCNKILLEKRNKIIIFSEWDRLLSMIGTILQNNDIQNLFCKGNVHQRNNTISRFRDKKGKDRVMMLSTENAASGSNLTEATHIIFMEPHIGEYGAVKAIEDQAVGRAERIGQENQVIVHRLITKNTVEEDIFNKYKNQLSTLETPTIDTEVVLDNDI